MQQVDHAHDQYKKYLNKLDQIVEQHISVRDSWKGLQ